MSAEPTSEAETPLWSFSLAVHDRAGVAPACRALRDRHGLDVNLLLACCWAGQQGLALDRDDLARLIDRVADWQRAVVQPLRRVRQWLETQGAAPHAPAEALRQRLETDELTGAQLEQAILHAALTGGTVGRSAAAGPRTAAANLNAYFAARSLEPGVADAADLAQLLTASFGERLRPLDAVWQMQAGDDALPA